MDNSLVYAATTLCAWLRKCKIATDEVKGKSSIIIYMRLLEALVDLVLL